MELSVARRVAVELAYARSPEPLVLRFEVEQGATLREAIECSGVLQQCPGIDLALNGVGVFGRARKLDEPVSPGDRIEIYQPLPQDPKELRRRRAGLR